MNKSKDYFELGTIDIVLKVQTELLIQLEKTADKLKFDNVEDMLWAALGEYINKKL